MAAKRYQFTETERATLEHSMIPFAIYQFLDRRVATLILSDGFLDLFGYAERDEAYRVAETDMYRDTHPDDVARIADVAYRFATEGGRYEVIYRSKNRERTGYNVLHGMGEHVTMPDGTRVAHVWYTNEGPYIEGMHLENAELNQRLNNALHEESILNASHYDHLTGLPAMTYFFDLAETGRETMLNAGQNPALLFMDLSGMKFFNSQYGFAEGTRLLQAFAKVLAGFFKADHCCRFSGDHFVVFTQEEGLEDRLGELFAACEAMNGGLSLPVRVGVYTNSMEDVDISTACDRARLACDSLRDTYGSGYSYFARSLRDEAARERYIVSNLDRAIQEKWITVYYQPIVRTVSGRVCNEEALAR